MKLDAKGVHYKDLNIELRKAVKDNDNIELHNVNGQRFIGAGFRTNTNLKINGVPGNDLGVFMDGMTITVSGNTQDGAGNTLNSGKIIVHGDAGDVVGYAMRGGKVFIKGDVGYRVGIHMKEYNDLKPTIMFGGSAGDFLGEYMAGGIIIMLNLKDNFDSDYVGTGMHGGVIYIRGDIPENKIGKGISKKELDENDKKIIQENLKEFYADFNLDFNKIKNEKFIKLIPTSHRPHGRLYCY
tara:strand:+ start:610 stop:1329 length:720 start_codon:yes stop_codon:yes gene_type:complete